MARLGGPDDGKVTLLDETLTPVGQKTPQPVAPTPDKNATAIMRAPKDLYLNEDGINFIKEREEFRSKPYRDKAGHCTIGYGQLLHKGECTADDFKKYPNGLTENNASAMLKNKVKEYEDAVRKHVKVPLTQDQFNALVSFTYNEGPDALRTSGLLKKLNAEKYDEIPNELRRWNKITVDGQKRRSQGLANRRELESQLFKKDRD